jgi:hypothetical protein
VYFHGTNDSKRASKDVHEEGEGQEVKGVHVGQDGNRKPTKNAKHHRGKEGTDIVTTNDIDRLEPEQEYQPKLRHEDEQYFKHGTTPLNNYIVIFYVFNHNIPWWSLRF